MGRIVFRYMRNNLWLEWTVEPEVAKFEGAWTKKYTHIYSE